MTFSGLALGIQYRAEDIGGFVLNSEKFMQDGSFLTELLHEIGEFIGVDRINEANTTYLSICEAGQRFRLILDKSIENSRKRYIQFMQSAGSNLCKVGD